MYACCLPTPHPLVKGDARTVLYGTVRYTEQGGRPRPRRLGRDRDLCYVQYATPPCAYCHADRSMQLLQPFFDLGCIEVPVPSVHAYAE